MLNAELDREKPLFDAALPMRVGRRAQARGDSGTDDDAVRDLTVRILTGTRPAHGPSQRERVLHVEVTDAAEPYFLFTLDVGEDDFHELKRDQALLVDFDAFPKKFIELLECCQASADAGTTTAEASGAASGMQANGAAAFATPNATAPATPSSHHSSLGGSSSSNRFVARLETDGGSGGAGNGRGTRGGGSGGSAMLAIVETNPFKQLTHLALGVRPGDDAAVKHYLAGRLHQLLRSERKLSAGLSAAEQGWAHEQTLRAAAEERATACAASRDVERREEAAAHAAELAEKRDAALQERESTVARLEANRAAAHAQLEASLQETRAQLAASEAKAAELSELKYRHEADLRDLRSRAATSDGAAAHAQADTAALREAMQAAEGRAFSAERDLNTRNLENAALSQQVSDKEALRVQAEQLASGATEARQRSEQEVARLVASGRELQERLRQAAADVKRGNEAIERLANEARALKDKGKAKSECIKQQEVALEQARSATSAAEQKAHKVQLDCERQVEKCTRLENELEEANRRLADSSALLESNCQTIAWLNQELNQSMGSGLPPTMGTHAGGGVGVGVGGYKNNDYKVGDYKVGDYKAGSSGSQLFHQTQDSGLGADPYHHQPTHKPSSSSASRHVPVGASGHHFQSLNSSAATTGPHQLSSTSLGVSFDGSPYRPSGGAGAAVNASTVSASSSSLPLGHHPQAAFNNYQPSTAAKAPSRDYNGDHYKSSSASGAAPGASSAARVTPVLHAGFTSPPPRPLPSPQPHAFVDLSGSAQRGRSSGLSAYARPPPKPPSPATHLNNGWSLEGYGSALAAATEGGSDDGQLDDYLDPLRAPDLPAY